MKFIIFQHNCRIIPESIRWLLAKKQNKKAGTIIRKAAAINGVKLSEVLLSKFEEQSEHLNEVRLMFFYNILIKFLN